jgi:hypothetical protein
MDSYFAIKNSLERQRICRVRKIYSIQNKQHDANPPSKLVFLWVEWNTSQNASDIRTSLMHNLSAKLFKLDRWEQPICTKRDDFGNAILYDKWILELSSREVFKQYEKDFGSRADENVWSKYLGENETDIDTDDKE